MPTRIERFTSRTDAEMARSVLQANGIRAYVSGDDAGGLHPELPYGIGGTAVVVPEDRYDDAVALLGDELGGATDLADLEAAAMASGPAPEGAVAGPGPAGTANARRTTLVATIAVAVIALVVVLAITVGLPGFGF